MKSRNLFSILLALFCAFVDVNGQCGCPNCQPCPQCAPVLCVLRSPPPTVCSCLPPAPPPQVFYAPPPRPQPWSRWPLYLAPPSLPPAPLNAFFAAPPLPPQLFYDVPAPLPPTYYVQAPPLPPPCFCRPQEVPCNCLMAPPPCACDAPQCSCNPTLLPAPPVPPFFAPQGAPLFDFGIPPPPVPALPPILGLPCPCAPNVRPCACPPNTYLFRFPFARSRKMRRYRDETKESIVGNNSDHTKSTSSLLNDAKATSEGLKSVGQILEVKKLVDVLPRKFH